MCEKSTTNTRVRIAYKIDDRGQLLPDIVSEADDVCAAMANLEIALERVKVLAKKEKTLLEEN